MPLLKKKYTPSTDNNQLFQSDLFTRQKVEKIIAKKAKQIELQAAKKPVVKAQPKTDKSENFARFVCAGYRVGMSLEASRQFAEWVGVDNYPVANLNEQELFGLVKFLHDRALQQYRERKKPNTL